MNVEELQAEAKKLGYRLTKIPQKPVRLLPCPICGKMPRPVWYKYIKQNPLYAPISCNTEGCTFEGFPGRNEQEAREGWNKAIELYLKRENSNES